MRPIQLWFYLCAAIIILSGCADVTVTKVTSTNRNSVAGVRYSLPKPFIQVVPQPDDTILVTVVMLPDADNTYAIQTSSQMSSYAFQISLNQNGTLSAVEFKQDTSAVGQQLAASAAATSTQLYNVKMANVLASQSAVNTAQAAVDTTQSAYDVALAKLNADTDNNVAGQINADKADVQAKQSALQDAKAVLARVRAGSQVGSYTAQATTPITTTAPAATTGSSSGFGPQSWGGPIEYELPDTYGAVLYAVNESFDLSGRPVVKLQAAELDGKKQAEFSKLFSRIAALAPALRPINQVIPHDKTTAALQFTQPIYAIQQCDIFTSTDTKVIGDAKCAFTDPSDKGDHRSVNLTLPKAGLAPNYYKLSVGFSYQTSPNTNPISAPTAVVSFTIQ